MPLVSFIITYHNEPVEMLREAVNSVLALSLGSHEREIIIIDDGSDVPLTDAFEGAVCIRQDNQGLSMARNNALERATGEYVQFLDADDYLLQAPYDKCLAMLRDGKPDVLLFNDRSDFTTTGRHFLCHHNLRGSACGFIFRRSLLGNLRFKAGIYHEDELFTPQLMMRAEALTVTAQRPYYYRRRDDSITHATGIAHREKRLSDFLSVITELRSLQNPSLDRRIHQLTMDFIYNAWQLRTNRQDFLQHLHQAQSAALLPLPLRLYSLKYLLFALLTVPFALIHQWHSTHLS